MSPLSWILLLIGLLLLFLLFQWIYLAVALTWGDQQTQGLAYYGKPPAEREAFKATLRRQARVLYPILRLIGRFTSFSFDKVGFRHRDIAGPRGTCSPESFARADTYEAGPEDVFVVTQMKCGTTWMQHVVYEVLRRGHGDIVESGTTLYAICPWLEAQKSVPVGEAPLVGEERPSRIIKTHLPVTHCPWSDRAKYIYVARHPVSCFASCVDFIGANVGTFQPELEAIEAWYCSDAMWWGPWTTHVEGWWRQAQAHPNVHFVYFEDMKKDLPAAIRRVAGFLGVRPLSDSEVAAVAEKCGFAYMRDHENAFEMHPPHLLATDAALFVRGSADRYADVPEDVRTRIRGWVAGEMKGAEFPMRERYGDVVTSD